MRLPTAQEQQELRDNNRRIAEGIARIVPQVVAVAEAWKVFSRQMGTVAAATLANTKARLKK